jgi:hypothetical protein
MQFDFATSWPPFEPNRRLLCHRGNFDLKIQSLRKAAGTEKIQSGRRMLETLLEGADDIDLSELQIPSRTLRATNVMCHGPYGSYGCPPLSGIQKMSIFLKDAQYMYAAGSYSFPPPYSGMLPLPVYAA